MDSVNNTFTKKGQTYLLLLYSVILCTGLFLFGNAFAQDRPTLLILCNVTADPSNEQSLVRLLAYSNQVNIKGICITGKSKPDENLEIIQNCIFAYGQVYAKLSKNENNYPAPEGLLDRIKMGKDYAGIGKDQDSQASDWIITTIDQVSDQVWICIWDEQRELAQALWKIKQTRDKQSQDEFIRKIRIHALNDKDHFRKWILENFPEIFYIADGSMDAKDLFISRHACYLGQYLYGNTDTQHEKWIYSHIINNHGPLGYLYPSYATGVNGMKEYGTPTFMGLLDNGLNIPEHPEWGGFGGRFKKVINNYFTADKDYFNDSINEPNAVARWRSFIQNDFYNRMNWCVNSSDKVNHVPQIKVNLYSNKQIVEFETSVNSHIKIDASQSSDPDGDQLHFHWWFYKEASDYKKSIGFSLYHSDKKISFVIPPDATGRTIHLILEVTDNGQPSLTAFKRFVIHCR